MQTAYRLVTYVAGVLDRIFRAASFICLVVMLSLGTLEIFCRFVLDHSFVWVPGMVILSSNWLIFLGMGVYLNRRQNMEVSYFYNRFFGPGLKRLTDTVLEVFFMIVLVIFIKNTFLVILMEQYQSSLINIPLNAYWYTLPLLLGCCLAVLSRVEGLMAVFLGKQTGKPREQAEAL